MNEQINMMNSSTAIAFLKSLAAASEQLQSVGQEVFNFNGDPHIRELGRLIVCTAGISIPIFGAVPLLTADATDEKKASNLKALEGARKKIDEACDLLRSIYLVDETPKAAE